MTSFVLIARPALLINKYSRLFGVSPVIVAGSIADEYNTRQGLRRFFDWAQDHAVLNFMPNALIQASYNHGYRTKWLNATRHDLGAGNINLRTARDIYKQFDALFPKHLSSWADMVDYLLTDEGTIVVTALVIKKGMRDMAATLIGRTTEIQEAILVTYYKQGPAFLARYRTRVTQDPAATISPGEGCRTYHQRFKLIKALNSN